MKTALFTYTNYRGDVGARRVFPRRLQMAGDQMAVWGYKPGSYLLECFDYDKDAMRTFALLKITRWCETDATECERLQYRRFCEREDAKDRAAIDIPVKRNG